MLAAEPGARDVEVDGAVVRARVADSARSVPDVVRAAAAQHVAVVRAHGFAPTLDDVFLALTGRSLRESAAADPTDSLTTDREGTLAREDAA